MPLDFVMHPFHNLGVIRNLRKGSISLDQTMCGHEKKKSQPPNKTSNNLGQLMKLSMILYKSYISLLQGQKLVSKVISKDTMNIHL